MKEIKLIKDKKVLLFGCGSYLDKWYRRVKESGYDIPVDYICDNDINKIDTIHNTFHIKISNPDILSRLNAEDVICLITSVYYHQIVQQINEINPNIIKYKASIIEIFIRREQLQNITEHYEVNYQDRIQEWLDASDTNEVTYWDKGLAEAKTRKDHRLQEREFLYKYHDMNYKNNEVILDVGSGPLPKFGNLYDGNKKVNYIPVDPLAYQYKNLLKKYDIHLPVEPNFAIMEHLSLFFAEKSADYIIIHNALDHSIDIVRSLIEVMRVLKPGGTLCMMHMECEGTNVNFDGLHHWDICLNNLNELLIADAVGNMKNISQLFKDFAKIENTTDLICTHKGTTPVKAIISNIKKINDISETIINKYDNSLDGGKLISALFERHKIENL